MYTNTDMQFCVHEKYHTQIERDLGDNVISDSQVCLTVLAAIETAFEKEQE